MTRFGIASLLRIFAALPVLAAALVAAPGAWADTVLPGGGDARFGALFDDLRRFEAAPVRSALPPQVRITVLNAQSFAATGGGIAVLPGWSTGPALGDSGFGHITVSRAADALGAPVDFTRPIGMRRRAGSNAGSSIAMTFAIPSGLPVAARAMTSGFGMRRHPILGTGRLHAGVDLAAGMGSPIVAPADGVVSTANWQGGYGLLVAIDHGGGLQTRYGHMSRLNVYPGQVVRRGDVIGNVGSTGLSTGPHLHYEMRRNGVAINPFAPGGR